MVQAAVSLSNVDPEQIHLVLSRVDLLAVIDALRSVGQVELAKRLEVITRHPNAPPSDQWWKT